MSLLIVANQSTKKIALESQTHKINYQQFQEMIHGLEDRFSTCLPITKSPCILLFNNTIEFVLSFFAITNLSPAMPINPALPLERVLDVVSILKPAAVICDVYNQVKGTQLAELLNIDCQVVDLDTISKQVPKKIQKKMQDEDIALILHTSGTTAKPKCVPLTYRNLKQSTCNIISTLQLNDRDRNLNMMPLFHIHGIVASMLATISSGGCLILKDIDFTHILEHLRLDSPTWYTAVPTIHHKIYQQLSTLHLNNELKSLRFIRSSSSPLSESLQLNMQQLMKIPIIQAYGMTEAAHQIASNALDVSKTKPNSVGQMSDSISLIVMDDSNKALPPNDIGELCIKGANVFHGYLNNPTATEQSFIGQYFRTGDLGFVDEAGYIFLTGRKKELINKGGFKISPLFIDQLVLKHPKVLEAVTFAVPHESLGEDIQLLLVPKMGLTENDMFEYLHEELADYMLPSAIHFVSTIPKSDTGKINRLSIAKLFADKKIKVTPASKQPEPSSALEKDIILLWEKILKKRPVLLDDNFFQLGGNSLFVNDFNRAFMDKYQMILTPIELYKAPTVRKFAAMIASKQEDKDWISQVEFLLKKYESTLENK